MARFIWLHHAQAEAFMAMLLYCNLPTSLFLSEGGFRCCGTDGSLNSASSARCLSGPSAAAERRGRRRKWRSRFTPTQRASLGRRSLLTAVSFHLKCVCLQACDWPPSMTWLHLCRNAVSWRKESKTDYFKTSGSILKYENTLLIPVGVNSGVIEIMMGWVIAIEFLKGPVMRQLDSAVCV